MYAWIWRKLPGATGIKLVEAALLVVVVVALLLFVVFPWIEPTLPFTDPTAGS
ncbi:hypothetical protein DFQ14_101599 [Halopolyspora algeriensis]|uniref:Uncharacterized protein n=1 Tax=Halopolyspora algeriensis TaxID=1500506 RepID=A0A368VZ70_9ACTN|nr:hypothetical protein [Halopolyspora algeriensis]RCW47251.1 hypothetical protein DFQ14_101599 [Halopolyspora algeriensis]TQM42487.1 hypothetical protein FHU43_4117 [Halopolyspora algeriensis]